MTLTNSYYRTYAPDGQLIDIPITLNKDQDIYTQFKSLTDYQQYYQQQGYVIYRNLITPNLCEQFKQAFQTDIKPYQGYLYRQVTGNPEKHQFSSQKYMLNALLNLQDLESRQFKAFKQLGLTLLTYPPLIKILNHLLDHEGILIQSMFFEGNSQTWAHQDAYYLDSSCQGKMVGIWIALEDIAPQAGRFFVYPQSHLLDIPSNTGNLGIATYHQSYKEKVIDMIQSSQLSCHAPYLQQGDVLFWNSYTIHGSLKTDDSTLSRCSLTAHYIPNGTQLVQYQKRIIPLKTENFNHCQIHHPKNLDHLHRKLIFDIETRFPRLYQWLKKQAIQRIIK